MFKQHLSCALVTLISYAYIMCRSYDIDGLAQRKEFPRAYEKLCEGRTAMDKAQRKYNRTAALFEEYLQLHREANVQLTQLKERCIEVRISS